MSATINDRIAESAQGEQASSDHNPSTTSMRNTSSSNNNLITRSASKRQREHDEQLRQERVRNWRLHGALKQLRQKVASLEAELKTSQLQSRQTECALCQESIFSSCWVVDKCCHVYHSQCFLSLLLSNLDQRKRQRCPLCREQLLPLRGEDESYEQALINAILESETFITFAVKGLIRLKPEHFTAFLRQGDGIFSRIGRIGGMFRTKWSQYKLLMSWMVERIVSEDERGESDSSVSMLKNLCQFCEQLEDVHESSSAIAGEIPASYFFQPEYHGTERTEPSSMNGKTLLQLSVLLLDKAKNNMEREMCFRMLDVLLHQKDVLQTLNAQDDNYGTVLYEAVTKIAPPDVVERCLTRLLQEGARPDVQCTNQETVLHVCAKDEWFENRMLPLILRKSENVNLKNWMGQTALFVLFMHRSPMDTRDFPSCEELFFLFLDKGALLETRDRDGNTLLHLIFRHWTVQAILKSKKILARLIHLHVLENKFGYTALDEPKDTEERAAKRRCISGMFPEVDFPFLEDDREREAAERVFIERA